MLDYERIKSVIRQCAEEGRFTHRCKLDVQHYPQLKQDGFSFCALPDGSHVIEWGEASLEDDTERVGLSKEMYDIATTEARHRRLLAEIEQARQDLIKAQNRLQTLEARLLMSRTGASLRATTNQVFAIRDSRSTP